MQRRAEALTGPGGPGLGAAWPSVTLAPGPAAAARAGRGAPARGSPLPSSAHTRTTHTHLAQSPAEAARGPRGCARVAPPSPAFPSALTPGPREPRHGRRSTHLSFSMSAAEACEKPKERVSRQEACAPRPHRAELAQRARPGNPAGPRPWEARPCASPAPSPGRGPRDSVGAPGRGRVTGEPARAAALPVPSYAPRGEEGTGPGWPGQGRSGLRLE